jgi:hypothetical protein
MENISILRELAKKRSQHPAERSKKYLQTETPIESCCLTGAYLPLSEKHGIKSDRLLKYINYILSKPIG